MAIIARGRVLAQGDPTEIASRYGGSWRLWARLRDGTVVVRELDSPLRLGEALASLGEVREVRVEPPSLEEAFRRLAAQ